MRVVKHPDALERATHKLNSELASLKTAPVLFMLSGGSALRLLDGVERSVLGPRITITALDERFSSNPAVNNFAQVMNTSFYLTATESGCRLFDTRPGNNETLGQLAERLDRELKNWRHLNPKGLVLATQGVGADGHTAGIMPYPENPKRFESLFINTNRWAIGYDAGNKTSYPLRITTTIPFLKNAVDVSILYLAGDAKREPLKKILANTGTLAETPARVLHKMKNVMLFTSL